MKLKNEEYKDKLKESKRKIAIKFIYENQH